MPAEPIVISASERRALQRNMAAQPGYRGAVPFNLQTFRALAPSNASVVRNFKATDKAKGNARGPAATGGHLPAAVQGLRRNAPESLGDPIRRGARGQEAKKSAIAVHQVK